MSASLKSETVVPAALTLSHWGWRYADRKSWAVSNVTIRAQRGERILLLGASGSGKSTLLQGIAGLLHDGEEGESAGSILVGQPHEVTQLSVPPAVAHDRLSVGLVMQDPDAQLMMARVGDEVAFGCENLGVPRAQLWQRVRNALAAVGLAAPLDAPTAELSGGQKQRLALAAALAMQPDVILLDEPTAMLDPAGVREVHDAVAQLAKTRDRLLVIVEHRTDVWLDLVDRVIVLGEEGIVLDGAPDEIFETHREALVALGIWLPEPAVSIRSQAKAFRGASEESTRLPRLTANQLTVGWNRHAATTVPELSLQPGSILAITAPNGAGKSTLALTLGGLLAPIAGTLSPNASEWSSRELVRQIGTVFQTPDQQFVARTVRGELELGASDQDGVERDEFITNLARRLRLEHLLAANPHTLSGGEKRRLSVASALAARPPILIFDEPTFGQDAHTWRELAALFSELRTEGAAIAVVTHDERFVDEVADRELRLEPISDATTTVSSGFALEAEHVQARKKPQRVSSARTRILTVNPLAKLAASAIISVALILSLDWVSALVALACTLPLLAWSGLTVKQLAVRIAPLTIAAVLAGFTTVLYGQPSGTLWFSFGLIEITDGSLSLGLATALRVLAIAIPAVVLFGTIEPVDLADSLEQRTRLPARFILGSLVALRLIGAVRLDWDALTRARRSRGLGEKNKLSRFLHQAFALFVLSLRRADKLALAMQSRAFDSGRVRSWARVSPWGSAEWLLIIIATAVATLSVAAAVAAGTWHVVFGGWQ